MSVRTLLIGAEKVNIEMIITISKVIGTNLLKGTVISTKVSVSQLN